MKNLNYHTNRHPVIVTLFALGVAIWLAAPAQARSLKEAVELALASHPQLQSARAITKAAAHDSAQARGGRLPSIDLDASAGKERSDLPLLRSAGVNSRSLSRSKLGASLTQNLYDGSANRSDIERLDARHEAVRMRLMALEEEIATQVAQAYIEVLKHTQLVKLAQDNLHSLRAISDKINLRVRGGLAQRADQQQAAGRLALSHSVLIARQAKLREVAANYQRVVGEAPRNLSETDIPVMSVLTGGKLDAEALTRLTAQTQGRAIEDNPRLRAASSDLAAADAALRGVRSAFGPRVDVQANVNRDRNIAATPGSASVDSLMFVMRWNLFRGGADEAQERALAERRSSARDDISDTRRQIEERVALAMSAKAASEELLGYLAQHVSASTDVVDGYRNQLDVGRRTLLDVLNAEDELFNARSNLAAGRYEDQANQIALEAAKGSLLQSLNISSREAAER